MQIARARTTVIIITTTGVRITVPYLKRRVSISYLLRHYFPIELKICMESRLRQVDEYESMRSHTSPRSPPTSKRSNDHKPDPHVHFKCPTVRDTMIAQTVMVYISMNIYCT